MTFSMFAILMILIVLLVAFIHMIQGLFSAAVSAVLAVFSAVLALSWHEVIVEKFLGGRMADSAHAMVLLTLFAAIYLVLRTAFDSLVPGNVRLPAAADKIGGAVLGAVAGVFAAGVVAVAAQELSFMPSLAGYARYAVDSPEVTIPGKIKSQDASVTDQMTAPSFAASEGPQKLLLPVDDILIGATARLSEVGSLSTSDPLTHLHPDWLQELFGQRAGVEPGARRVLLSMPNYKTREAYTDGVFLIQHRELPWIDAEFADIRKSTGQKVTSRQAPNPAPNAGKPGGPPATLTQQFYSATPGHVLLIVRVRFNHDAADKSTGLIRVSPGGVRLVTHAIDPSGGVGGWADNYPVGTLEYRDARPKGHPRLPTFVMVGNNVDDFIFVRSEAEAGDDNPDPASPADSGVDFVYNLEAKALGWPSPPPGQVLDPASLKLPDGVFIEIKRLAREDLGGHPVLPEADLNAKWGSIRVLRKTDQMDRGLVALGLSGTASPGGESTAGAGTTAPPPAAPPPVAPVAPPPPPAATFALDVQDPHDSTGFLSEKFFTNVNADAADGKVTVPGGSMTLEKGKIRELAISGATPSDLRSAGKSPYILLVAPEGKALVQIIATPKAGAEAKAWSWKDQFASLNLKDANGAQVAGPPVGVWVSYTDAGAARIMGRYNADGGFSVADLPSTGEIRKVWFVFAVPHPGKLKSLDQGAAVVKDLGGIDVP